MLNYLMKKLVYIFSLLMFWNFWFSIVLEFLENVFSNESAISAFLVILSLFTGGLILPGDFFKNHFSNCFIIWVTVSVFFRHFSFFCFYCFKYLYVFEMFKLMKLNIIGSLQLSYVWLRLDKSSKRLILSFVLKFSFWYAFCCYGNKSFC